MKRKLYLLLMAGCLSAALLLSACGSDETDSSAGSESSAAVSEQIEEEDDENTDVADDADAGSEDSESTDSTDDDTDAENDADQDTADSSGNTDSTDISGEDTISDKKLKKQVKKLIEEVSENQASQSLASAGYEPTVTAFEGELMVYIRMPDPADMPFYAEALCDYVAEAEEKYDNFSLNYIYLRTYEEADEGYVEDGTLISWATSNGEDGMFLDEPNNVTLSDFTVDDLKSYYGTE